MTDTSCLAIVEGRYQRERKRQVGRESGGTKGSHLTRPSRLTSGWRAAAGCLTVGPTILTRTDSPGWPSPPTATASISSMTGASDEGAFALGFPTCLSRRRAVRSGLEALAGRGRVLEALESAIQARRGGDAHTP